MRSHHGLRRTSIVAGIGVALLFGAQPAAAAPTDTAFPRSCRGGGIGHCDRPPFCGRHVRHRQYRSGDTGRHPIHRRPLLLRLHSLAKHLHRSGGHRVPRISERRGPDRVGHRGRRRHSADRAAELSGSDDSARWWCLDSPLTEPVERVHRQLLDNLSGVARLSASQGRCPWSGGL